MEGIVWRQGITCDSRNGENILKLRDVLSKLRGVSKISNLRVGFNIWGRGAREWFHPNFWNYWEITSQTEKLETIPPPPLRPSSLPGSISVYAILKSWHKMYSRVWSIQIRFWELTFGVEHYFRSSIPPCGNILCEETCIITPRIGYSSQAKITNLKRACQGFSASMQIFNRITFRSQLVLMSKFEGLRSRWITLAEWMYFNPRKVW